MSRDSLSGSAAGDATLCWVLRELPRNSVRGRVREADTKTQLHGHLTRERGQVAAAGVGIVLNLACGYTAPGLPSTSLDSKLAHVTRVTRQYGVNTIWGVSQSG